MESGANRSYRAAHDFRDLLVAVLLDIGQDDDLALVRRELFQRTRERFAELTLDIILDGSDGQGPLTSERLRGVVLGDLFLITSFFAPKFIAVQICYDAINPRQERGPRLEAAPRPVDADERFLGQVAGIGLVVREAVREVVGCLTIL